MNAKVIKKSRQIKGKEFMGAKIDDLSVQERIKENHWLGQNLRIDIRKYKIK